MDSLRRLRLPAAALVVVQLVHGAIPGPSEGGSILGPVVGVVLIVSAVVAFAGAHRERTWAPAVLRWTGIGVAAGFLAYHAFPVKTPLNYPYWGPVDASVGQWAPVLGAMAVGAWAAWAGRPDRQLTVSAS